ncbi:MAG: hypothetical protein Ct9H300mP23_08160 [Nitrospinota bacterium]|nr:MAG: hypothetical protein Ct9H300mP23_08160 [Nitrospinota bacterium]
MLSVEGLGGFYIPKNVGDRIRPTTMGGEMSSMQRILWTMTSLYKKMQKSLKKGTPNTISIHAFGAALGLLLEAGIDNIEKRFITWAIT